MMNDQMDDTSRHGRSTALFKGRYRQYKYLPVGRSETGRYEFKDTVLSNNVLWKLLVAETCRRYLAAASTCGQMNVGRLESALSRSDGDPHLIILVDLIRDHIFILHVFGEEGVSSQGWSYNPVPGVGDAELVIPVGSSDFHTAGYVSTASPTPAFPLTVKVIADAV